MDVKSEEIIEAMVEYIKARTGARESAKEIVLEVFKNQAAQIKRLEEAIEICCRNIKAGAVGINWIGTYLNQVQERELDIRDHIKKNKT